MSQTVIVAHEPISMATENVDRDFSNGEKIQMFEMTLDGVRVELCNLGASILKLDLPPRNDVGTGIDCVLGYKNPIEMMKLNNPVYFGGIVGRVANRIKKSTFQLSQKCKAEQTGTSNSAFTELVDYKLDANNGPNHLHGGLQGFSHKLWNTKQIILDDKSGTPAVQFSLISKDGDQGYPGSILIIATYSLGYSHINDHDVVLRLKMQASLMSSEHLSTPINLAQHSYFNLAGHDHPNGILDHHLTLFCEQFTPTDSEGIPTKQVIHVSKDATFDFRPPGKVLKHALDQFGREKAKSPYNSNNPGARQYVARAGDDCSPCLTPGTPYGFDHNFCINNVDSNKDTTTGLYKVAELEYRPTKKKMTVFTDAPGVQVYTSNYLDGTIPKCKAGTSYLQWQAICLETQAYPDSIADIKECNEGPKDFMKGACFLLTPGGKDYEHNVEYHF